MFIVHRQYTARQLSDYLRSLPLASFPIGPISCYPSSPGHRHLPLDLPPRPKPRRRAGESCAGRQAVLAPARVTWSPYPVANCPSWHPSRSMSLMSREPMVPELVPMVELHWGAQQRMARDVPLYEALTGSIPAIRHSSPASSLPHRLTPATD